jgi:tRNA (Thr-GGU) A37 N-methylase
MLCVAHVCLDRVALDSGGNIIQETHYSLYPIGFLRSPLKDRGAAPNHGREGAPDAWLEVDAAVAEGLEGIEAGDELIVITWLHQAARDILKTHPRNDQTKPLGLHRVTVREIAGTSVKVGPIEAIDGTPVVDIKPVLSTSADF